MTYTHIYIYIYTTSLCLLLLLLLVSLLRKYQLLLNAIMSSVAFNTTSITIMIPVFVLMIGRIAIKTTTTTTTIIDLTKKS